MTMTKNLILLMVLLLLVFQTTVFGNPAKKASITGTIVDAASGQPIEYANLVLLNPADSSMVNGTISGTDGSFLMEGIDVGIYQLKAHFIGFETAVLNQISIASKKDHLDLGSIPLKPSSIMLSEAEIVGNNDYIDFKIDKKVINVSEHINAEGGAVVEALQNVPSVQVDAAGNVSLRGSTSFTLLIDGRPSVLAPSDALNQIPSSSIEKIEVITNPSVKYDAEGTSGIINLITKKQKISGTSGQATATLATGDKYSANVLLNQRVKKLSTSFGATYSNKRKQTESRDDREVYENDNTFYEHISSDRDIYWRNYILNGGLIYDADDHNSFSLNAEIGQWEFDRTIESKINLSDNIQPDTSFYQTREDFLVKNKYLTGDAGYRHLFAKEGHQIDVDIYFSTLNNETPNHITENELENENDETPLNTGFLNLYSEADRNHLRFNLDYTLPISDNLNLEAGYQNDSKNSLTDYSYQYRSAIGEDWITDNNLSGEMDFSRMVNAAYFTLGSSVKGIAIQGGLRMETVKRSLEQKILQKKYDYDDVNFFPSLHLSKAIGEQKQISLSYSRRIGRPNQWMLLPALNSTGRNMLQLGNPDLLPDFTDSYELGFSSRTDALMLSTDIYLRNTKNSITTTMVENDGIFYQTYENLGKEFTGGADIMGNLNINSWWQMNLSASVYYNTLQGTLESGYEVDNASLAWNGMFKTTFIVKKKTFLEFMTVYYGPSTLPQGKAEDFYYFDFFARRSFFHRKLTVALRSHNTFDSGIYIEDSEGTNFKAHTWFNYEGPTFMATVTYKFNNYKRKNAGNNLDMNYDSGLDH